MIVMLIVVCYLRVVAVFHDSLVYENYLLHAIWHSFTALITLR